MRLKETLELNGKGRDVIGQFRALHSLTRLRRTFVKSEMSLDEITSAIIGAAIKVHRKVGPGLLESAYRVCLAYELRKLGFRVREEEPVPIVHDDLKVDCAFRADLLVEESVIAECKAKEKLHPVDEAQLISHLR
jgi:GxxExxY protein